MKLKEAIKNIIKIYMENAKSHVINNFGIEKNDEIKRNLFSLNAKIDELNKNDLPIKLVVAGEFSSGKSSVINSLIGEKLIPTGDEPMTLVPCIFKYGENKKIIMEYSDGVKKEITIDDFRKIKHNKERKAEDYNNIKQLLFHYPYSKLSEINIIDTPGYSTAKERGDDKRTDEIIKTADAMMWVIDANNGTIKESEIKLLNSFIKKNNNIAIICVLNKVDVKGSPESLKVTKIIDEIKKNIFVDTVLPYSAQKILGTKSIEKELDNFITDIKNRLINNKVENNTYEFRIESDDADHKTISISNGAKLYFEQKLNKHHEWLTPLTKLNKELDKIRNNRFKILENSIGREINKQITYLVDTLDKIIEQNKKNTNELKSKLNEVLFQIKELTENVESEYNTHYQQYIYNFKHKFQDQILKIETIKNFFGNDDHHKITFIHDKIISTHEKRIKFIEEAINIFDYKKIVEQEINKISNIMNHYKINDTKIKDLLTNYKTQYSSIYRHIINMVIILFFEIIILLSSSTKYDYLDIGRNDKWHISDVFDSIMKKIRLEIVFKQFFKNLSDANLNLIHSYISSLINNDNNSAENNLAKVRTLILAYKLS